MSTVPSVPNGATCATYEVLAIRFAARATTRSSLFLNHHVYGPDGPMDMDFFLWVARNRERTVIIDTGYGQAARQTTRLPRTELAEPVAALAGLGVHPQDAPMIIATHAHYDHIGNLTAFPRSEIVIGRAEFDFWTGPYATRQLFAHTTEPGDLAHLVEIRDQGRATFVDQTTTVAPGIEVIPVGGHTPGQLVVSIATATGRAVLTSDAAHFYEEVELDRPFAYLTDLIGVYRAYALLREMAAEPDVVLVPGHDPDVMRRFPVVDGTDGLVVRIA